MARVLGVAVLFTLTIVQMVNADSRLCRGLAKFQNCGDDGRICVCANENVVTTGNKAENPCNNLVCRFPDCYYYTGMYSKPKKIRGEFVTCFSNADCGKNFECTIAGFCCRSGKVDLA
ncbi:uncharacterized protein LOC132733381 [Ruditapes philippinarum]|uniref:uncharacterized protein LOC132733381 n=1 Tax=Ruditapes philippinarum TaxID=129788 RepID=UPI00295BC247|nr:uncharacterized protein LOC132733381 [Ruditapes philippinarum]